MRTCNYVLASLVTVACIVAQEPKNQRKTGPGKLDFTFPRRPLPEKRLLDFTFPPIRPLLQQPNGHQNTELGKLDFTLRPQSGPTPQERLFRPKRKIRLVENPSPCAVPLLEAQIPKDRHFFIEQIRPRTDRLVPMPNVKVPAPSCGEKPGTGSRP